MGQVWLIGYASFEAYLKWDTDSVDKRCGPKTILMEHPNKII